jgi:hypothetical protein
MNWVDRGLALADELAAAATREAFVPGGFAAARAELRAHLEWAQKGGRMFDAPPPPETVAVPIEDALKLHRLTHFNTSSLAAAVSVMASEWLSARDGVA